MEKPKNVCEIDWAQVMRFEAANSCNFFSDNECREYGSTLLSKGDLHASTIDGPLLDRWFEELGGEGHVSILVVDGDLRLDGDLLAGSWLGQGDAFRGVLVTGNVFVRNLEIGPNTRLLVLDSTFVRQAVFLLYPEGGADFQGPVRATFVVGDPDEFPVDWTLDEETTLVKSADDLPMLPLDVLERVSDEGSVSPHAFYDWLVGEAAPATEAPEAQPAAPSGAPSTTFLIKESRRQLAQANVPAAWAMLEQLAKREHEPEARAFLAGARLAGDIPGALALAATLEEESAGHSHAQHVIALGRALQSSPSPRSEREQAAAAFYQAGARAFSQRDFVACADAWIDSVAQTRKFGDDIARIALLALFELLAGHPLVSDARRRLSTL